MFKVIRASFNQRRKTLANGLNNYGGINLTKEQIQQSIEELGVPVNIRGEALSLEQFACLSNIIGKKVILIYDLTRIKSAANTANTKLKYVNTFPAIICPIVLD